MIQVSVVESMDPAHDHRLAIRDTDGGSPIYPVYHHSETYDHHDICCAYNDHNHVAAAAHFSLQTAEL